MLSCIIAIVILTFIPPFIVVVMMMMCIHHHHQWIFLPYCRLCVYVFCMYCTCLQIKAHGELSTVDVVLSLPRGTCYRSSYLLGKTVIAVKEVPKSNVVGRWGFVRIAQCRGLICFQYPMITAICHQMLCQVKCNTSLRSTGLSKVVSKVTYPSLVGVLLQ